ncbi:MAG: tetratricopeptide repeat protein [Candidatus Omnitrophica bacterium]|nr:tetratricopeptide repeat protein [Candidatus Omnitrophota bacterium]
MIMLNFTKHNISKITSTIVAIVFLMNSAAYGIDLSGKSSLRTHALGNSDEGEIRLREGLTETEKSANKESRKEFLIKLVLSLGSIAIAPALLQAIALKPTEKRKVYTEVALDNAIRRVLFDLKYPDFTHDELIKVIIKSLKIIDFNDLYKTAMRAKNTGEKDWQEDFLRNIVDIIREKRFAYYTNELNDVLEKLMTSLAGENIFAIKGSEIREAAEIVKRCSGLSAYLIICLQLANFDAKTASIHGHVLVSLIDNNVSFVDPSLDKIVVIDKEKYYADTLNNFITLKKEHRNKTLEEMIAFQEQIIYTEDWDLMNDLEKFSPWEMYPYVQILEGYGITSIIYSNLGWFYYRKIGDLEKALEMIEKGIDVDRHYAPNYFLLACIYEEKGDYDKAIEYGKRAKEIDPNYASAYYVLATSHKAKGDFAAAMEYCNIIIDRYPNLTLILYVIAGIYEKMQRDNEAIGAYEENLKWNPGHIDSYLGLIRIFEKENDYENLLRICDVIMRQNLNDAPIYYKCGLIYEKTEKHKAAKKAYSKASKIDPEEHFKHIKISPVEKETKDQGRFI